MKGIAGIVKLILIIVILGMAMGIVFSLLGFLFKLVFPIVLIYLGYKKVFKNKTVDGALLVVGILILLGRIAHFI